MLSLKQLKTWFQDTENILKEISMASLNLKRIARPADKKETGTIQDEFVPWFHEQLVFILVVQLCKLYISSDTERRNFRKLFNRLRYDVYDESLKKCLRKNRGKAGLLAYKAEIKEFLKPWSDKLDEREELIHRMKTLRDRVYVHSDPSGSLPSIHPEELLEMTNLAMDIYSGLKSALFDESFPHPDEVHWLPGRIGAE